jgi:transmembrane sensor
MWNRIEARARLKNARRPGRRRVALGGTAVVVLVGILGLTLLRHPPHLSHGSYTGPLLEADGSLFHGVHTAQKPAVLALNDGSTISLDERTDIESLDNSATMVVVEQPRGTVLYDISPGGPRRWTIDCGLAVVEVVGTTFRVERTESRLVVEVMRGTVLVHGARVPEGATRLTAGMRLELSDAPRNAPPISDPVSPPVAAPASATRSMSPPDLPAKRSTWRELAKRGEHDQAYAELGPDGLARASNAASVDDLLELADVARLSGHPREAVAPLESVIEQHAADTRASLAAFTLGRVQMESLRAPMAAARAFEKAIALGVPGGLLEDAYAHLAESRSKAGDEAGAKAAYLEYVARFPRGAKEKEVRRWVSGR